MKSDASFQADQELQRRFGLHWVQPPPGNYRGTQTLQRVPTQPSSTVSNTKVDSQSAALDKATNAKEELRRRGGVEPRESARKSTSGPFPILGWSLVVAAIA